MANQRTGHRFQRAGTFDGAERGTRFDHSRGAEVEFEYTTCIIMVKTPTVSKIQIMFDLDSDSIGENVDYKGKVRKH